MKNNRKGYIYVLTNESFHRDNWIKIGYAEDVNRRVKELSNTSIPLPYELYCTYEIPRIEGVKDPDKLLHDLIVRLNPGLRIAPNREFFQMQPFEAYEMLRAIAQMHGRADKVVLNDNNSTGKDIERESEEGVEKLFLKGTDEEKLYNILKDIIIGFDSKLEESSTRLYVVFKSNKTKKKNVICLWPKSGWIEVILNAKIGELKDENDLIYDISNRKWSSAQYAFRFNDDTNVDAVRNIIKQTIDLRK